MLSRIVHCPDYFWRGCSRDSGGRRDRPRYIEFRVPSCIAVHHRSISHVEPPRLFTMPRPLRKIHTPPSTTLPSTFFHQIVGNFQKSVSGLIYPIGEDSPRRCNKVQNWETKNCTKDMHSPTFATRSDALFHPFNLIPRQFSKNTNTRMRYYEEDFSADPEYEWIEGYVPEIIHRRRISNGTYGEVHHVRYLLVSNC